MTDATARSDKAAGEGGGMETVTAHGIKMSSFFTLLGCWKACHVAL